MTAPTFYIIIYGHAGDTIYSRPFIKELIAAYPNVTVVVECVGMYAYLLTDLGVKLVTAAEDELEKLRGKLVTRAFEPGTFVFHQHVIAKPGIVRDCGYSHSTIVHTYNAYLKDYGLYEQYHIYDRRDVPFNTFPAQPHVPHAKARAVLVENGPVLSGQSEFDLNEYLQEFTEMFPNLNFYCAAKPNFTANNVFDVSAYNLIELSELSNSCVAFLTRCSGVNAASLTEKNKYKPRCFAGVISTMTSLWGWEIEEAPVTFASGKGDIIDFLSYINRNREVLPIHLKNMETHPDKYKARLQDYVGDVSFCKFLSAGEEINGCIEYLKSCLMLVNANLIKNREMAYILSDLTDGNHLDIGNSNYYLMLNTLVKGIPGEKYVIALNEPAFESSIINNIFGDFCEGMDLPGHFFQNITCLTASGQNLDIKKFACEASRLLSVGGTLYVTFDYWETKAPGQMIFDKNDVLTCIAECGKNGLKLTEDMNWQLGDACAGAGFTVGMLRFKKTGLIP